MPAPRPVGERCQVAGGRGRIPHLEPGGLSGNPGATALVRPCRRALRTEGPSGYKAGYSLAPAELIPFRLRRESD